MKYDVILQAVVNVKVPGIEAESQKDAILAAQEKVAPYIWELFKRDNPVGGVIACTEWSEGEYADFLVDEEGDWEFKRSRWGTENSSGDLEPV